MKGDDKISGPKSPVFECNCIILNGKCAIFIVILSFKAYDFNRKYNNPFEYPLLPSIIQDPES